MRLVLAPVSRWARTISVSMSKTDHRDANIKLAGAVIGRPARRAYSKRPAVRRIISGSIAMSYVQIVAQNWRPGIGANFRPGEPVCYLGGYCALFRFTPLVLTILFAA